MNMASCYKHGQVPSSSACSAHCGSEIATLCGRFFYTTSHSPDYGDLSYYSRAAPPSHSMIICLVLQQSKCSCHISECWHLFVLSCILCSMFECFFRFRLCLTGNTVSIIKSVISASASTDREHSLSKFISQAWKPHNQGHPCGPCSFTRPRILYEDV
jgi:hypothetical protein